MYVRLDLWLYLGVPVFSRSCFCCLFVLFVVFICYLMKLLLFVWAFMEICDAVCECVCEGWGRLALRKGCERFYGVCLIWDMYGMSLNAWI
jgi:hypothetical protein